MSAETPTGTVWPTIHKDPSALTVPPCRPPHGWSPRPSRRSPPVHELRMPSLGADMEHGKVVEWLVHPGDTVHQGDLIAVVDTDKTLMDVESFEDGIVRGYAVDLAETVPVGTPILSLAEPG
ncbi:biotin/lipoyl-containing protein [Sinomonas atrocyanea]|uniref:biotin/lipoyl-containing protein n=1 Tax=Sinomonas atrocyanea TaxID=37927 RepID=UPI0027852F2C|nr:biotin/lipoyl-containing protein [Sinomonas atrocyanea]MDQ0261491.1 biotin carboxyl carrier protein [Sinomonas atrocyanea]